MRFEVSLAVKVHTVVFRAMASCSLRYVGTNMSEEHIATSIIRVEVRKYVPLKGWYASTRLHDVMTHKDTTCK
jgi:hypothetical protein